MAGKKERAPLSTAQVEIMNVVWGRQEVTVAEVWKDLSMRRSVARNTVQTLMSRLEEKGWLKHRVESNAFVYRAAVERSRALRHLVWRLVDTVVAGSAEGLVMALLDGRGISAAEAARIREMVEREETVP